ncbi:malate synthase G, partial [Mesorhizobium sp. CC13]
MTETVELFGLSISRELHDFVVSEAMPGTGVDAEKFWSGFADIVHDLAPKNRALLEKRDDFQLKLDAWYRKHGAPHDMAAYKAFLSDIGYLVPEGPAFAVTTENVDPEIATVAGPQLVVPVMNARYALNAANARWGSLYDALYGTDAISDADGAEKGKGYNPKRGQKVIAWAKAFLDGSAPLEKGGWSDVAGLAVEGGALKLATASGPVSLRDAKQFAGYRGEAKNPDAVLLVKNGLHVEVVVNRESAIGKTDPAGISDMILESALTTIQDCEDSVAAVDAEDKVLVYRNW